MFLKSIAAPFIIFPSSCVVNTKFVSATPFCSNCLRLHSTFFAVQGIIDTTTVFSFVNPSKYLGNNSFNTGESIDCGDLQVERFGINSGCDCSMSFPQACQQ